jgi:1,4-dihydroxy-2-naphthoyl-CoA hydrolase
MSIWFIEPSIEALNISGEDTMFRHIGIEFTEVGDDFIKARMPVDERTVQPFGTLHGGASVALAETLGSTGAYLCVDPQKYYCTGVEVNANHIRPVKSGFVYGTAKPIHIGRSSQIWSIEITDEDGKLVCISRLTLAVIELSY